MSTDNGATVMIAPESSYGSVLSSDARALDDATIAGLTARSLRCTEDSFIGSYAALKQTWFERSDIAMNGGNAPVQVSAAIGSSGPVKRLSGDVPLAMEGRGFGATAPADTALGRLLSSGLAHTLRTPGTSVTATYVTANTFTIVSPTDDGKIVAGDVIAVVQANGTFLFCMVTSAVDGGATITVTTLEPHGYSGAGTFTVRQCHMWWAPTDNEADGVSLVAQFAPKDAAHCNIGVGGRLAKVMIAANENKAVDFTCTVRFPDGEYRDAVVITPSAPLPIGGAGSTGLRTFVSPIRITEDHSASSAPASGTAATFPVRTWSVEINIALIPQADGGTRSGLSGMRVSSALLTGTATQSAPTTGADFREVGRLSEKRSAAFTAAGDNAAGNGMCVWVGAVEPTADPGVTVEKTDRTQQPSFKAGDFSLASGAAAYVNRQWVLAFVA